VTFIHSFIHTSSVFILFIVLFMCSVDEPTVVTGV